MTDGSTSHLLQAYRDHFGGNSISQIPHSIQEALRGDKLIDGPGQRPRLTWKGVEFVEQSYGNDPIVQEVQATRKRLLKLALDLGKDSHDGRFDVAQIMQTAGLSREVGLAHLMDSPLFSGRFGTQKLPTHCMTLTNAGRRLAQ